MVVADTVLIKSAAQGHKLSLQFGGSSGSQPRQYNMLRELEGNRLCRVIPLQKQRLSSSKASWLYSVTRSHSMGREERLGGLGDNKCCDCLRLRRTGTSTLNVLQMF